MDVLDLDRILEFCWSLGIEIPGELKPPGLIV